MDTPLYDSLHGQVALVTGATRGIGEAIAAELADLDATVYAGARTTEDVPVKGLSSIQLDVTEDADIEAAIDRIDEEEGQLDILVNNAGFAPSNRPLHEASIDEIDTTLSVNLRGPIHLTKYALPLLLEGDGGRVVNISSGDGAFEDVQAGHSGISGQGVPSYRISKVGLNGLTAYLDGEYSSDGLIANAACPGSVRTDMGRSDAPQSPTEGAETPVWLARFKPNGPSGLFWRDKSSIPW